MSHISCYFGALAITVTVTHLFSDQFLTPPQMPYTVNLPNGEVLTGQLWRIQSPLFSNLPFTTNIFRIQARMNQDLTSFLDRANQANTTEKYGLYVDTSPVPAFLIWFHSFPAYRWRFRQKPSVQQHSGGVSNLGRGLVNPWRRVWRHDIWLCSGHVGTFVQFHRIWSYLCSIWCCKVVSKHPCPSEPLRQGRHWHRLTGE